jgi:hypothetical protein
MRRSSLCFAVTLFDIACPLLIGSLVEERALLSLHSEAAEGHLDGQGDSLRIKPKARVRKKARAASRTARASVA